MSNTALTQGAHHIGLTVPNLADAAAFFTETALFSRMSCATYAVDWALVDGCVL